MSLTRPDSDDSENTALLKDASSKIQIEDSIEFTQPEKDEKIEQFGISFEEYDLFLYRRFYLVISLTPLVHFGI